MQKLISVFLFFGITIPSQLYGFEIKGTIKEEKTNLPVQYATVYINGTTIGTTSNINGNFTLSFDMENCQVIINHVSFESVIININKNVNPNLEITLTPKNFVIPQVSVEKKNLRLSNLTYFNKIFLGEDSWGRHATIKNDSVFFF